MLPFPKPVAYNRQRIQNSYDNPPLQHSGEVLLMLDTEGCLVAFRAIPPQAQLPTGPASRFDWEPFFTETGLKASQWTPAEAQHNPLYYADNTAAWQGSLPDKPGTTLRIESAAFQGKITSFEIIGSPWTPKLTKETVQRRQEESIGTAVFGLLILSTIGGALFFARRDLRLGRGDRRSATRLGISAMSLLTIGWVLGAHHVLTNGELYIRFLGAVSFNLFIACWFWIFYIALEPFVRRRWPQILISWTRLLSGEWRDPHVAREVLCGVALGVLFSSIQKFAWQLVPSWLGYPVSVRGDWFSFETITGIRGFMSTLVGMLISIIFITLLQFFLLFIMRILFRNQKAAIVACVVVAATMMGGGSLWSFAIGLLVLSPLWFFILIRFGLLAEVSAGFVVALLNVYPVTLNASAWYSGYGYAAIAIFAVIVLYSFRFSLSGRPLLAPSRLDE
jgi:hypothetical protein